MTAVEHTQSLADFRAAVAETLDRVNQTGEAEVITVDGEARGVLLSPAAYDELAREAELSRNAAVMRQALREHAEGKGRPAREFFDELQGKLLAMKAAQENGTGR